MRRASVDDLGIFNPRVHLRSVRFNALLAGSAGVDSYILLDFPLQKTTPSRR